MLFQAKVGLARATAALSRATGRGGGTTLPGRLLLAVQPDAIDRLATGLRRGSAVISATNGKTTTAKMAASILSPPLRLSRNGAGANLASGVASALIRDHDADLGLFEVDEAALPGVAASLSPRTLVLGNLFRDQLDRYGELELIAGRWRAMCEALPGGTALISNADDPLVASIGRERERHTWFGLDDPAVALAEMQHASDSKWCVRCGARYAYRAVYLGHLGDWACPSCGDARPSLDLAARDIRLEGLDAVSFRLCTPSGDVPVRLPLPGLYNVYNALAAAALALRAGAGIDDVVAGLERFSAAFGRFERIRLGDVDAVLLLVKNPAGANEVIRTLAGDARRKTLLVALNDRIADGRDVSWIWDVDFERLAPQVDRVVCTGTRAAEMGMRLKYADVDAGRIQVEPDVGAAVDRVASEAAGTAYLLATYTAMLQLRGLLEARGLVAPYWQEAA
ncbi:MAG TPA: MurT ligase domain-containing protein [Gaiellales bacterium]